MIKFENVEVVGWEHAIRGMRNPKNSWDKSDSRACPGAGHEQCGYMEMCEFGDCYEVGKNDLDLMMRLRNAGTDHRKFMRMIVVYVDITAPLYWWKEFDTYKVGTVANSCSTMHKIHDKEFTIDDFSHEHLIGVQGGCDDWWYDVDFDEWWSGEDILAQTVYILNFYRQKFIDTKDKKYWWQMIQLLPTSYNQKRTVMLNYGEGIEISIAGIPVDACEYELIQTVRNVTVKVLKCKKCGHIEIQWRRQENTEEGDE